MSFSSAFSRDRFLSMAQWESRSSRQGPLMLVMLRSKYCNLRRDEIEMLWMKNIKISGLVDSPGRLQRGWGEGGAAGDWGLEHWMEDGGLGQAQHGTSARQDLAEASCCDNPRRHWPGQSRRRGLWRLRDPGGARETRPESPYAISCSLGRERMGNSYFSDFIPLAHLARVHFGTHFNTEISNSSGRRLKKSLTGETWNIMNNISQKNIRNKI